MAGDTVKEERLQFGGMARWDGLDLFGPNFMSVAYRKEGEIHVKVEPSNIPKIENPLALRLSRLPILRSVFFWARLLIQVVGSFWTLVFFAVTMAVLWLFVRLMEFGSGGGGPFGGLFSFFAEFPILPILILFFAGMKLSPVGRYHGAEHKAVAAYEKYGEVTMQGAKSSSRIHPRCGTNILAYIVIAALLDPLISWWAYAFLQFILISEAWFVFGRTRPSITIGNLFQRYLTTTEPRRAELKVAVESMNRLLGAEQGRAGGGKRMQVPAKY